MSITYLILVAGGFLGLTLVYAYSLKRLLVKVPTERRVSERRKCEARTVERRKSREPFYAANRRKYDRRLQQRRVINRRASQKINRAA